MSAIEDFAKRTLLEFGDELAQDADPSWLPQLHDVLGCGAYGCVFSAPDPHVVVKLTTDLTEINFIEFVFRL